MSRTVVDISDFVIKQGSFIGLCLLLTSYLCEVCRSLKGRDKTVKEIIDLFSQVIRLRISIHSSWCFPAISSKALIILI